MIEIKNLVKKYPHKGNVLNGVNITIKTNEKIAFMGENGVGKTTLSEVIMGVTRKTSGNVIFTEFEPSLRKNAVFQEGSFDSELNLTQLVKFYCSAFKVKVDWEERLRFFGLYSSRKTKFSKLSGGQKQKFKFLIALLNSPNLLLLDELTTSLDYIWRARIVRLVKNYLDENPCTLILVSHNLEEVELLCNRIIFFAKGNITKEFKLPEDKVALKQMIEDLI